MGPLETVRETVDLLMEQKPRLCVIAAGAGAGIQQHLWFRPGASCFLVGSYFPYDKKETEEFLGFPIKKCLSARTAIELAQAAFMRACRIKRDGDPIGLGVTAAVGTNRERKGLDEVYVAVMSPDGTFTRHVDLSTDMLPGVARHLQGLIADETALVLLKDVLKKSLSKSEGRMETRREDEATVREIIYDHPVFFPDGRRWQRITPTVLFAGSFNPLHDGHRGIIQHAEDSSPIGMTVYSMTSDSLHKPPLSPAEILKRAAQFRGEDYPLLITRNDALFILKARQFPRCTMVMGVDSLVRVLEPKWFEGVCPEYEDQGILGVLGMLAEFRRHGTTFDIFDRVVDGKLQTLDTVSVPKDYRDMFRRIPLHWDISSTELRESGGGL